MEKLQQQVRKARGRMNFQTFVGIVTWSLFAWLVVAAVALAVPKLWALGFDAQASQTYAWAVAGGSLALGLITAGVWTWLRRRGDLEAAIELDQRFGLKERVSSTLALTPDDLSTEAGQALVADAVRRVERIDVGEQFGVKANWRAVLPLIPALIIFALAVFVPDAVKQDAGDAQATVLTPRPEIKTALDDLKKKIAERQKAAEDGDLEEAADIFNKMQKGLDSIHEKNSGDKKKAMVQLNNLAKQIKDQAQKLRDADDLKKQMNNLKDIKQGPADKLAKALQEGNFDKAADELKDLQDKLKKGDLNEKEQQKLKQQMQQMQDKLQQLADAHQQAQQDLKEQIEKAKQEGDLQKAGQLQQKLDQLQQQQQGMDRMQQMANQLGQAAQALEQGNAQAAAEQLDDLQQQMGELQDLEDQLQNMEDALDEIAKAKEAMNCKQCQGGGCKACQGQGFGQGRKNGKPGMGLGEGQGRGARPEEEHDTGGFDSQVRGKVGAGQAYVVGKTGGPNKSGEVREEIKNSIRSAVEGSADPLTNERLPRSQRDHVKEYYDGLRSGGIVE